MMDSSSEFGVSYYGFVGSTYDALILFEACIAGQIKNVTRRPQEREKKHVIQSGRVFIYEEKTSGIKRWTDGISWSPSRVLGNFLIYRQLSKAYRPGEKKKVIKKPKTHRPGILQTSSRSDNSGHEGNLFQNTNGVPASGDNYGRTSIRRLQAESALAGSLTDADEFLEKGLVKKTISVIHGAATYHLVSYYTISDAIKKELIFPSQDPKLAGIHPRASLITSQNFRNRVENFNYMECLTYPQNMHEMNRQTRLPSQIKPMPESGPRNSNGTKTDKVYTISHTIAMISTASEQDYSLYDSTNSHHARQISARGIYSPLESSKRCNSGEEPQSDTLATPRLNYRFGLMCDVKVIEGVTTARDSQGLTELSIMERTKADLVFRHEPSSFCESSQGVIPTVGPVEFQGSLSALMQVELGVHRVYEQKQHSMTRSNEIGFWRVGNASAGHGHYHSLSENKCSSPDKR